MFCGPTGSGKSTTMATLVDAINATRPCHIITIEDPIEYLHENHTAVVHQREVGIDAQSFERALRAALREDPDVVLVGEMRDPESIAITLTLAETGHLVVSSLHTNDASQTLDRIVDVFPAERQGQIRQQLASTLSAVVAQRLVPRIGSGLIAAYEVLLGTPAGHEPDPRGQGEPAAQRDADRARAPVTRRIEMSLNELVAAGIITHETAVATAFVPHEIKGANVVSPLLGPAPLARLVRGLRRHVPGRRVKAPGGSHEVPGAFPYWVDHQHKPARTNCARSRRRWIHLNAGRRTSIASQHPKWVRFRCPRC